MAFIKKRRRSRRKKGAKKDLYFGQDTQDAIVKYQNTEEPEIREYIYNKDILPAFDKLVENLVHMHGFAKHADFDVVKNDCLAHLYESLGKWKPERGTKAFSYYNVVAKNYLIIQAKKRQKRRGRHISLEDEASLNYTERHLIERHDISPSPDELMEMKARPHEIQNLLKEIKKTLKKENEIKCINAIIEIFERVEELDFLNKRAVFVYLREISGLDPKRLSIAMSPIRKQYKILSKGEDFNIF